MKKQALKIITIFIAVSMLLSAMPFSAFAFGIDPKVQIRHTNGSTNSYSSLNAAVSAATDGDTIYLVGEEASHTETGGVSITKNVTFMIGKDFNDNKRVLRYNGTSTPLFTVESGAVLQSPTHRFSAIIMHHFFRAAVSMSKKAERLCLTEKPMRRF